MGKLHRYKNISENVYTLYLDKSLKTLRDEINTLIEEYGEEAYVSEAEFDEWDGFTHAEIYIERKETDEELAKRQKRHDKQLAKVKKDKEKLEERERKALKKLLKKYPEELS